MRHSPFSALHEPQPDVVFAASARAKAAGPSAIDGTVGMVLDDEGRPVVLQSVRKAMAAVAAEDPDVGYSPIRGKDGFRDAVGKLIGADEFTASVATTGGTGAVSANAHLLSCMMADVSVGVPTPTWANHAHVLRAARLHPAELPYLGEGGTPTVHGILRGVRQGLNAMLLHGTCHNPTGLDLTEEQWGIIAREMAQHGTIAMVDFAYQGIGDTPENDAKPIGILREAGVTTLIAWSGAKNHTLYAERPGLAAAFTQNAADRRKVQGEYDGSLRAVQSSSPGYGQRLITAVQEDFNDMWRSDLRGMRMLIAEKRRVLAKHLPKEFGPTLDGKGMFALLPLLPEQVSELEKRKVFLLPDGRINIAGIPEARLGELAEAINGVLR